MTAPQCNWSGASGRDYSYYIHPLGTRFLAEPGNYIFARMTGPGRWSAVYVGETECLGDRCRESHEKWTIAVRNGATHIHAHVNRGGIRQRLDEETDLRRRYRPPCNDQ